MEIKASEFKAKCLEIMDRVAKTREEIVITKRGKAMARLLPVEERPELALFGRMRGTFQISDKDLLEPASPADEWHAFKGGVGNEGK